MPVNLRGGPPERLAEDAGSSSKFVFGKFVRHRENATPLATSMSRCRLDQAKNDFDGDPRGHSTVRGILRGREFPRANRLHGTVVQAHADSLNELDLGSVTVRANQNAQRDAAL